MELKVTGNNKKNNPLRLVSIVVILFALLSILIIALKFAKGHTLREVIEIRKVAIFGLSMDILFLLCYWKKNIFAWWIALLYMPATFVFSSIFKSGSREEKDVFFFFAIVCWIFYYLQSKYEAYKKYIGQEDQLEIFEIEQDNKDYLNEIPVKSNSPESQLNNNNTQNPLQIIFYASMVLALLALIDLFRSDDIVQREHGDFIAYFQQITLLTIVAIFAFFYQRRSVLAWWIVLLFVPVPWIYYFVFQPFQIKLIIIPIFINAYVIWYLAIKYRPYCDYIKKEKSKKGSQKNQNEILEEILNANTKN